MIRILFVSLLLSSVAFSQNELNEARVDIKEKAQAFAFEELKVIIKYEDQAEVIQKEEDDYQKKTNEDFKFVLEQTKAKALAKYAEAKENNVEAQALADIKTSGTERYKNLKDEKNAKIQEHKDKLAKRME